MPHIVLSGLRGGPTVVANCVMPITGTGECVRRVVPVSPPREVCQEKGG